MAPSVLFTGVQVSLQSGVNDLLLSFHIPSTYATPASAQFSAGFVNVLQPVIQNQFANIFVHAMIIILGIGGLLLWLLATIRIQNIRTISMLSGSLSLLIVECVMSAFIFGTVTNVRPGYEAVVIFSIAVPTFLCIGTVARSLTIVTHPRKNLVLYGLIGLLTVLIIIFMVMAERSIDYATYNLPGWVRYISVVLPIIHMTFAFGVFGLTLLKHVHKMAGISNIGSRTTRVLAIVSNICATLTTLMWIGYMVIQIISATNTSHFVYANLFISMIPLIEFINDNSISIVRVFFPSWVAPVTRITGDHSIFAETRPTGAESIVPRTADSMILHKSADPDMAVNKSSNAV